MALSESGTRSSGNFISGNFILINAHTGFWWKILPITETVALSESGTRSSGNFILINAHPVENLTYNRDCGSLRVGYQIIG